MIKVIESKAFILALLTLAAAIAGYEGLNIPVATVMGLLTPLMIAIGAAGWSDAVKMKAKMALEHEVKMHALNAGLLTHADLLSGKSVPQPRVGSAQAGVTRIGVMMLIVAISGTIAISSTMLATSEGCATVKPLVDDVIHCAQAESTVVSSGYSIIQIVMEVVAAVQKGPSGIETAIEDLIKKYGGDVVACVLDSIPEPTPPTAGSGAGSSVIANASPVVIAKHIAMTKFFAGKKIDHSTKK